MSDFLYVFYLLNIYLPIQESSVYCRHDYDQCDLAAWVVINQYALCSFPFFCHMFFENFDFGEDSNEIVSIMSKKALENVG